VAEPAVPLHPPSTPTCSRRAFLVDCGTVVATVALAGCGAAGFQCVQHGAQFGPTGAWQGGQRTSSMRSYPATYDAGSGTVTIG